MSLTKRLAGDAIWVLISRLVIGGSSLVIVAMLSKLMAPEDLGHYMLLVSLVLGISTLSLFGMDQVSVREIAKYQTKNAGKLPVQLVKNFFLVSSVALLISSLLIALGGSLFDKYFFKAPVLDEYLVPVCLWVAVLVFAKLSAECFRGMHKAAMASVVGETLSVVILISLVALVMFYGISIDLSILVWLIVVSYGISTAAGVILLSHFCSSNLPNQAVLTLLDTFSVGRPITLVAIISFFISQADLWVLALYFDANEVATYGLVLRVIALVSIPLMIVTVAIKPYIPTLYEKGEKQRLENILRTVCTVILMPSAILLLGLYFYGGPLLAWTFGQNYAYGSAALSILVFAKLIQIGTGSCGQVLIMTGHQKDLLYISITSSILLMICLLATVENFGMIGCAGSTAIAVISQNILMLVVAKKRTGIWTHATFNINLKLIKHGLRNKS
jgi:O-antigen/teichoic acid export membrane protein